MRENLISYGASTKSGALAIMLSSERLLKAVFTAVASTVGDDDADVELATPNRL